MEKAKERMLKGKKDPVQNSAQGGPAAVLTIGGKKYIEDKGSTRDELAKLAGVSHDTMSKVETMTIIAGYKKPTENFDLYDFRDSNCQGRIYIRKGLAAMTAVTLTVDLRGDKIKVGKSKLNKEEK